MYVCLVCGYDQLRDPPEDYTICPCCGTEFEFDDSFSSHFELRNAWINSGARWWSRLDLPPENWDPYLQVNKFLSSRPDTSMSVLLINAMAFALRAYGSLGNSGRQSFTTTQYSPSIPDMIRKAPKQSTIATDNQNVPSVGIGMTNGSMAIGLCS